MNLEKALKAITITSDTVLFVDIDQIRINQIENREELPKGLLIVGVVGEPNVLAMTRTELQEILDQKNQAMKVAGIPVLPREGKAQESEIEKFEREEEPFFRKEMGIPVATEEECGYCGGTGEVACSSTSYMSCPACSKGAKQGRE